MKRMSSDLFAHMQRTGNAEIAKEEALLAKMEAMLRDAAMAEQGDGQ